MKAIGRLISSVVRATPNGISFRLIGTVDIDGKGTKHPLEQADPFMLLDYAPSIPKNNAPPFGAHPHRGHSVLTILTKGKVMSWDSFTNKETIAQAPASYWVDAGSGIFHDEVSRVDDESDESQHVALFQLWVSVKEEDRLKPAGLQYDMDLPAVEAKNADGKVVGSIRHYCGGGAKITTPHPIVVAHVVQQANTSLRFPVDPAFGGVVIHMSGCPTFAGATTPSEPFEVLVLADTSSSDVDVDFLDVTSSASEAEYLICVGEQVKEPWFKKLVANGAVIAKSPEEAREIAQRVEEYAATGKTSGCYGPFGVQTTSA